MERPVAILTIDSRSWGPGSCARCPEDVEDALLLSDASLVCPACLTPLDGFEEFSKYFVSARPVGGQNGLRSSKAR